jgi:hypothetical protein
MGTLVRQVVVSPPRPPARLLFDFVQQDLLLNTLFVAPGNSPPRLNFESPAPPRPKFNPALYDQQLNYTLNTVQNFRRIQRQIVVNPILPKQGLRFDFVPQNLLLNVGSTPPGNPVFQRDLSGPPLAARRNQGLYDVIQNYSLRIPVTAVTRPPFTPLLGDLQVPKAKWNSALYEFQSSLALQSQTISTPPFVGLVAPAVRAAGRQGLLPVLDQNLLNTLLSGAGDSPYIPIDISDAALLARRVVTEQPYNAVLLRTAGQQPPPNAPDYIYPVARRIDYTITARSFLTAVVASKPIFPLSQELPPLPTKRSPDLYASYSTSIYMILASIKPPISYSSLDIRPRAIYNIPALEAQPAPVALLATPSFVANLSNVSYNKNNGTQTYNTSIAFTGVITSYSISPGLDAGITFNTATGVISTDTTVATVATHGPYIVTATNGNGNTPSNAFTISIGAGNYKVDGPRVTLSTTALSATYGVSGPNATRDKPTSEDLS